MGALLAKHDVKPYLIFMFPLAQLPVFMSMFFGLRRAAESFPVRNARRGACSGSPICRWRTRPMPYLC